MKRTEVQQDIAVKMSALEQQIAVGKEAEKSVGRLKRALRALKVVNSLLEHCPEEFAFELENDLYQMIECKKGSRVTLDIKAGDSVAEVFNKFGDVKDLLGKIRKMGLDCDWANNKIVRQ